MKYLLILSILSLGSGCASHISNTALKLCKDLGYTTQEAIQECANQKVNAYLGKQS